MDFIEFAKYIFYGLMGGVASYGVYVLAKIQASIEELNVKVAVVISRSDSHEKRLDKLEEKHNGN